MSILAMKTMQLVVMTLLTAFFVSGALACDSGSQTSSDSSSQQPPDDLQTD